MCESEVKEIILNGVEERRNGDTKDFDHCDVLSELLPIRREGALLVEHHPMTCDKFNNFHHEHSSGSSIQCWCISSGRGGPMATVSHQNN